MKRKNRVASLLLVLLCVICACPVPVLAVDQPPQLTSCLIKLPTEEENNSFGASLAGTKWTCTVPNGTDLSALRLFYTITENTYLYYFDGQEGKKLLANGAALDFSKGPVLLRAETEKQGGTAATDYTLLVEHGPGLPAIVSCVLRSSDGSRQYAAVHSGTTIKIEVPTTLDLSNNKFFFTTSTGSKLYLVDQEGTEHPLISGDTVDFSGSLLHTLKLVDKESEDFVLYTLSIQRRQVSSECLMESFVLTGAEGEDTYFFKIDNVKRTVQYFVPPQVQADLERLQVHDFKVSDSAALYLREKDGDSLTPLQVGDTIDCSVPRVLIVEAEDGSTRAYDLTVQTREEPTPPAKNVSEVVSGITLTCTPEGTLISAQPVSPETGAISLTIPETIGGISVTAIEMQAFYGKEWLREVAVPEGVTRLGGLAFAYSRNLVRAELPSTLETQTMAFAGCSALEELVFHSTVLEGGDDLLSEWGDGWVPPKVIVYGEEGSEIEALAERLQVPFNAERVPSLGGCLVIDPKHVLWRAEGEIDRVVSIPEGVTEIREGAFEGLEIHEVSLPKSLKSIGTNAFFSCSLLREVEFHEGLESIGSFAFMNCASLGAVYLPSTLNTVEAGAFFGCTSLEEATVPGGLKSMGGAMFYSCIRLRSVTLGEGLSRIDGEMFANCLSLRSIKLPASVKTIYPFAFEGCKAMKGIVLPDGLETIGDNAFYGCKSLIQLSFPKSVQSIGDFACYDSGLREAVLSNKQVSIGCAAFLACSPDLVLKGYAGSSAQKYAAERELEFQMIGEGSKPVPAPAPEPSQPEQPEENDKPTPVSFADIANHWGKASIQWACERGLFQGVSETRFAPDANADRAMVVTVLWRLAEKPEALENRGFADVDRESYCFQPLLWAEQEKIISGTGDGKFLPNEKITREELAVVLHRFAGSPKTAGSLGAFQDEAQASSWSREALSWAVAEKVLSGKGNGILDPSGYATRAELAAVLERFAALPAFGQK